MPPLSSDRLFVVTGGPGAGKTALIEALAAQGVATVAESGRAIIREQTAAGGAALPWVDPLAYAEAQLERDIAAYAAAAGAAGPVVFDRGIIDVIGYLRLIGHDVPERFEAAGRAYRYNACVFIAPFWSEIYVADAERRQSPVEAEVTCAMMARVWAEYGYEAIELPRASISERAAFMLSRLD